MAFVVLAALWNLFLAVLPIPLGWALARRIAAAPAGKRWPGPRSGSLLAAWLLLLPNAPYLLTDARHFLFDAPWRDLIARAPHDAAALRATGAWAVAFLAYGALGLAAFSAAVRPVQLALRLHRPGLRRLRIPFFLVIALGVWLGLVPRLNSWDALLRPHRVLGALLQVLGEPATLACIAAFGLLLAVLHDVLGAAWDGWRASRAREASSA